MMTTGEQNIVALSTCESSALYILSVLSAIMMTTDEQNIVACVYSLPVSLVHFIFYQFLTKRFYNNLAVYDN